MRYPWCDTIPLLLFAAILLFLFPGGILIHGADPFGPWWIAGAKIALHLFGVIVVPVWIVLRAIDWMFAGPARRALKGDLPR